LKNLVSIFNQFDINKDRMLDPSEVFKALKAADPATSVGWVYKLMRDNDKNHDGLISFNEFKEMYKQISDGTVADYESDDEEKLHD